MLKTVIKEICIILLLSVAIVLVFGIIFYDYIPIGVTIPTKVAYETPTEVQNEIDDTTAESIKTEKTYEVTDSDLNIYKQKANYTEGKTDPFALEENTNTTTSNSTNIQNTNKNQSNNKNEKSDYSTNDKSSLK